MKIGMLWFDDDPRTSLEEKIRAAVAHYRQKYGAPNVCYVPPQALPADLHQVDGVRVRPLSTVPRHHLWVGVEADEPQPTAEHEALTVAL